MFHSRYCLACVATILLLTAPLSAKWYLPDLEEVPIERLIKNLTALSVQNPTDAQLHFHLARIHSMAYASKTDKAQIRKGKEAEGAWFGYGENLLPFRVVSTKDHKAQSIANFHLGQALSEYVKALEIDPKHITARLGYAWGVEQAGKKEIAIQQYRHVVELGWKKEQEKEVRPSTQFIVVEAARYLRPLLDPEKDKAELAQLDEKVKFFEKKGYVITPIAIPLQSNLTATEVEDRSARVRFDADGSGLPQTWSWIKPNAAWLVYDQRGTGKPQSGRQLFGNVTFWCFWDNGYEALRSLDNNRDGKLSGGELQHLALWCDANSNGIADAGEVKPLAAHGIVALSCEYKVDTSHADRIPYAPAGVTFQNGETRATFDLLLHAH